jgi:transposase
MATRTRRRHSREYKLEAVRLCENSGKSIAQISRELDVSANTLTRWRAELQADQQNAFRGNGKRTADAERIWQLERENERLKREREILKKVLAIVSQP